MSQSNRLSSLRVFEILSLGTALLCCSAVARAQDATQQPYRLTTTARLVVLDVVVLDKNDHPVPNLGRDQFEILEDKVPQTIRNFEASIPPSSAAKALPVVEGTSQLAKRGNAAVNVLVFDEVNSKFEDMAYARGEMEKYIKRQPEVLPVPTQLLAAGDSHFTVLHDYTQSRAALLDALKTHMPELPWQMMRNSGGDGALERMAQTLGILSQIADASAGTPGRKNVVWLGNGYPFVDTTTLDEEDQDKMAAVIKIATQRMLGSRVTLYIVDPTGVHGQEQTEMTDDGNGGVQMSTGPQSGLGPFDGKLDFSSFAAATGGEVFSERNDLDIAVDEGLKEAAMYYTLSYSPTSNSDTAGPFRKIRIVMKDPSLHAVTRDGYFPGPPPVEAPPAENTKPSNQLKWDLASAAQTTLQYNGLNVKAVPADHGYQLQIVAKGLSWSDQPDGGRHAEVTVMAVCYNAKSKALCHETKEVTEGLHAGDDIEKGQRVGLAMAMDVPANTTRVRFVVRDAGSGRIGSVDVNP